MIDLQASSSVCLGGDFKRNTKEHLQRWIPIESHYGIIQVPSSQPLPERYSSPRTSQLARRGHASNFHSVNLKYRNISPNRQTKKITARNSGTTSKPTPCGNLLL